MLKMHTLKTPLDKPIKFRYATAHYIREHVCSTIDKCAAFCAGGHHASSILSDSNVCSYFSLICVAVALNTRKMEHWQREGVKGAPSASIDKSSMNWRNYRH